jgi:hypothetical protein
MARSGASCGRSTQSLYVTVIEPRELDAWVAAYLEAERLRDEVDENHPLWWGHQKFFELEFEDPESIWAAISKIVENTSDERIIGKLAAGPLEDLIENHGPSWIERIESEARRNPKFRHLLGGVWESSTPEVWSRVEAARVKSW